MSEPSTDPTTAGDVPSDQAARGADTLMSVLQEAADEGYDVQQIAREGGVIECEACEVSSPAAGFDVQQIRRLEGASDSADELLVAWTACPNCERLGTVTLGYGPNANEADQAVLDDLDITDADPTPG